MSDSKAKLPVAPEQRIDFEKLYREGLLPTVTNPTTGASYKINKFLGKGGFGTVFEARVFRLLARNMHSN